MCDGDMYDDNQFTSMIFLSKAFLQLGHLTWKILTLDAKWRFDEKIFRFVITGRMGL